MTKDGVAEIQRAMARVCMAQAPDPRDLDTLGGPRALLYRDLVRSRLRELVSTALPRTERTIGRQAMTALFDRFLAEAPPRSRYLREVVPAFVRHVLPRLEGPEYPAHAVDVARLEGTQWELGWRAASIEGPIVPFDFERIPVPHPTLRLLSLSFAVHRWKPEDPSPPEQGAFAVCVHRRPDHKVETRWLDATGARLVDAWMRAEVTAIEGVRRVLLEEGREADGAFVDAMGSLLAALLESGAILGSRSPPP
jgi:hypothetical protein